MSDWNIPKITSECLRLMGASFPWDPTTSLDDAIPLIEKYGMEIHSLARGFDPHGCPYEFKWEVVGFSDPTDTEKILSEDNRGYADTAAFAVCLCALRCAGRNLDDFRVAS